MAELLKELSEIVSVCVEMVTTEIIVKTPQPVLQVQVVNNVSMEELSQESMETASVNARMVIRVPLVRSLQAVTVSD